MARHIPWVWGKTTPEEATAVRERGSTSALRRRIGELAPEEPVARLWHAATLQREHRGDGHNAALVAKGIGGTEAHVLMALALGMRAEDPVRAELQQFLARRQLAGLASSSTAPIATRSSRTARTRSDAQAYSVAVSNL